MSGVVADTHAAVWYPLGSTRLSSAALAALDRAVAAGAPVYIAAISLVEIGYLVEKGRLPDAALDRLYTALADPDSSFTVVPLDLALAREVRLVPREAVPEMPDRIIAATALHLGLPLVTRGLEIRAAGINCIW